MKYFILFLLSISFNAMAGQLSIMEGSRPFDTDLYYTDSAKSIQYSTNGEKYLFAGVMHLGMCDLYCGYKIIMVGAGAGKRFKTDIGTFFVQAGLYRIFNMYEKTTSDERIDYYMKIKFGQPKYPFKLYDIETDEWTHGITFGTTIPITKSFGVVAMYRMMRMNEKILAFMFDPPMGDYYWQDINDRDLSMIWTGVYYQFGDGRI